MYVLKIHGLSIRYFDLNHSEIKNVLYPIKNLLFYKHSLTVIFSEDGGGGLVLKSRDRPCRSCKP